MPTPNREQSVPSRKRSDEEPKQRPEPLKDDTRHGITVVVLFTVAAILFLSLFGLAGALGNGIDLMLTRLLGSLRYLVPVILVIVGYVYLVPGRITLRTSSYVGLGLFIFSSTALVHLSVSQSEAVAAVVDGRGGGYFGLALSYPLRALAGGLAAGVVL
ncbi:MAG: hypothetical protein HY975_02205, partial [Candidatus Kerfeldbacteria bacterium]|nr:hypothetical protein [Candidatus Kerfeldbacteria bacterium]